MNNAKGPNYKSIPLDRIEGLYTQAKPADLPEGASPLCVNDDFPIGSVTQRPGEVSSFTYAGINADSFAHSGSNVVSADDETPWTAPNNISFNTPGRDATVILNLSQVGSPLKQTFQFPGVLDSVNTFTFTMAQAVMAGDQMILLVETSENANPPQAVNDSLGSTWTLFSSIIGGGGDNHRQTVWYAPVSVFSLTPIGSDDFDRDDENPLSQGGNWTSTGDYLQIVSDVCVSANFTPGEAYYTGVTLPDDQYTKVVINNLTPNDDVVNPTLIAEVRVNPSVPNTGYKAFVAANDIFLTAGDTIIGPEAGIIAPVNSGDTVILVAIGTTISILHNGEVILSVTDATYTSGVAALGMLSGPTNSSGFSSFVCGAAAGNLGGIPTVTVSYSGNITTNILAMGGTLTGVGDIEFTDPVNNHSFSDSWASEPIIFPGPPTLVQSASKAVSDNSTNAQTFSSNVTAGNTILVGVAFTSGDGSFTCGDGVNTYVSAVGPITSPPNNQTAQWFYASDVAGGATTVTVHSNFSTSMFVCILEVAGADASNPIQATDFVGSQTGTAVAGNVLTTSQPNTYAVQMTTAFGVGPPPVTQTVGGAWTQEQDQNFHPGSASASGYTADQTVAVSGSTVQAESTIVRTASWLALTLLINPSQAAENKILITFDTAYGPPATITDSFISDQTSLVGSPAVQVDMAHELVSAPGTYQSHWSQLGAHSTEWQTVLVAYPITGPLQGGNAKSTLLQAVNFTQNIPTVVDVLGLQVQVNGFETFFSTTANITAVQITGGRGGIL